MTLCPMPLVCTTRKDTSVLPAALSIIAIVSNPSADDRGWPATVRPMSAPEDRTAEAGLYALLIVNRWSRMRSHSPLATSNLCPGSAFCWPSISGSKCAGTRLPRIFDARRYIHRSEPDALLVGTHIIMGAVHGMRVAASTATEQGPEARPRLPLSWLFCSLMTI